MLGASPFFAGLAVDDMEAAERFYGQTLGLRVVREDPGLMTVHAMNGYLMLLYIKPGHVPAQHTVLNFPVPDIEAAVDALTAAGVVFEHYDSGPIATDEKGIATPGPRQAWFRDPAGNILSVIQ